MTLKISKETRSKAYGFVKSLLKDGADGEQINALVNDMGEHIDKDIAGQILLDLLMNPEDVHVEARKRSTWFGPVKQTWFSAVAKSWYQFCEDEGIVGEFHFGNDKQYDEWRKQLGGSISDREFETLKDSAVNCVLSFHYTCDNLQAQEVANWLEHVHKQIEEKD